MKIFRIVVLLIIVLVVTGGAITDVRASYPIQCWAYCDNLFYSGYCWSDLETCCEWNRQWGCDPPMTYIDGGCTDGENYCP